jgi:hypothetical protein
VLPDDTESVVTFRPGNPFTTSGTTESLKKDHPGGVQAALPFVNDPFTTRFDERV